MAYCNDPDEIYKGSSGIYSFLDYSNNKYHQVTRDHKVICFDSGEETVRRTLIDSTLSYLLNIKGIPCVVLSSNSEKITKTFLGRVPHNLRRKVLNMGLYHLYLKVVSSMSKIMQELLSSRDYRTYVELFYGGLRSIESDLISALAQQGIVVIMDRSILTNYLYTKVAQKNIQNRMDCDSIFCLGEFKPYASFYVHGPVTIGYRPTSNMYDLQQNINTALKVELNSVKSKMDVVELPYQNSNQDNLKIIRFKLDQL